MNRFPASLTVALICLLSFVGVAFGDQCTGALPVGTATGCGAVITVTQVDMNGKATAFTVTTPGNGNPFDGSEDTLIGVQNSSGGTLNSMTLTSPDTSQGGLFFFDSDGPCPFNSSDCHGSTGYEGPDNTFANISADRTSGDVNFTTGIANGGSTWFALEGTPQSLASIGQTQTVPPGTTVTYTFHGGPSGGGYDYTVQNTGTNSVSVTVTPIELSQTDCNSLIRQNTLFTVRRTPSCFLYNLSNPTRTTSVLFEVTCSGGPCGSLDGFLGTDFNFTAGTDFNSTDPFPGLLKGDGGVSGHPCTPPTSGTLFQSNQVDEFNVDPLVKGGSGGTGSCWVATYNEGDEDAPGVTITSPTATTYKYKQSVGASYHCDDPDTSTPNLPENDTHPTGPYLTIASCVANSGFTGTPSCQHVGGTISCTATVDTNSVGPHTFSVTGTDTGLDQTTKTVNYTVGQASTKTTITASTMLIHRGQSVKLTATVTVVAPGGGIPTGSVKFVNTANGAVLGTVPLGPNGVATLTLTPNATIDPKAMFLGSTNYGASTSNDVSVFYQ